MGAGIRLRFPCPIGPELDAKAGAWRKPRVDGEFASSRVSIGSGPSRLPSLFSSASLWLLLRPRGLLPEGRRTARATITKLGVSVMRVSTVPLKCKWSASLSLPPGVQLTAGSKATWARGGHGRGPAGRGGDGGGSLVKAVWGGKRKWDGMASSATREAP